MSRSSKVGAGSGKRAAWVVAALVAGFALASLAALAGAKTAAKPKPTTLRTSHNAALGATIVVDSHGMTLYELKPETTRHLLCKTSQCFGFWPPLKTSKKATLSKASEISGKLGKLHRAGFYQVTLDGRPLYHFSLDKKKGQAVGQGIKTFGGTWHVVKTSASKHSTTHTTTSMSQTSTSTSSTYSYPSPY
jgi:predicted lipoprotein with Yx(FWY)xxD motif